MEFEVNKEKKIYFGSGFGEIEAIENAAIPAAFFAARERSSAGQACGIGINKNVTPIPLDPAII